MHDLTDRLKASFLLLFFAFIGTWANAQCEVNAGDNITICQGESVTLGGSPTIVDAGDDPEIDWSNGLGDDPNPIVSPNSTTTYTVTLTDDDGCDTDDSITVTVLPNPTADFDFDNANACGGVPVQFTNNSSGTGLEFEWDFGNPASGAANSSTANNPTHEFVAPGNGTDSFTVTLTVTDANGCTDSFSQVVPVTESPDPGIGDVNIFTPFEICGAQGQTTFDIEITNTSSTQGSNTFYEVDWGDGTPGYSGATLPNQSHTYNGAGFYEIEVTVTGDNGCTNTGVYEVFAGSNPSVGLANPGATINLCSPNTLVFPITNTENNSPGTEYTITFSDGSPPQTFIHPPPADVTHTFDISSCGFTSLGGFANSFYVQIIASNPCGFSAATIEPIQTSSSPTAAMDVFPGTEGCANAPFTFSNVSTNANYNNNGTCSNLMLAEWSIDPPTGWTVTAGSLNDPNSFAAVFDVGEYTITMNGSNPCGNDVVSMDICVTEPPIGLYTLDPVEGCAPLPVATENLSSSLNNCDNESYLWEIFPTTGWFVSEGSTTSVNPEFTFTQEGVYDVYMTVTNLCGSDTYIQQVTVIEPPEVDMFAIPDACEGTTVNPSAIFDDGGGTISDYTWSFPGGNPTTSNDANPGSVSYPNPGSFTIDISVTNECGTAVDSESFTVETAPNVTLNAVPTTLCEGQTSTLTANGAVNYTWAASPYILNTFDNTATVQPPVGSTTFTVSGFSAAGCEATQIVTVDVNDNPTVTADGPFEICAGDCIPISATVSGGQAPYNNYNWSPAGTLDDPTAVSPEACPPFSENYTVSVTDANGCTGSGIVPVTVNPLPFVDAGPDVTLCDQPVPESLTGFTPADGVWSGPNVSPDGIFTPNGTGLFDLTITATDANGCENTDQLQVEVIAPQAADAGNDQEFCQGIGPQVLVPVTPGGDWFGTDVTPGGTFTPTTPGVYVLTYELGGGSCLSTDDITVEVFELPLVEAGLDEFICDGDSVQLGASVSGGALPYQTELWNASPFLSDNTIADPWASPNADTGFTYTVTDDNGCVGSDDLTVSVLTSPVVEAGPNITLCDQPIPEQLTGFSPIAGVGETGEWTGPDITPEGVFTPNGAGNFTVYYTFTNLAGCSNLDSLVITVTDPTNANAGPDLGLCLNTPAVQLELGGTWTGTGVTPGGLFDPVATGVYDLTFTIGTGTCETSDDLQIEVFDLPSADAGVDVFICEADSIQLDVIAATPNGSIDTYSWTGNAITDDSVQMPWVSPAATSTYDVVVTDNEGCTATDQVVVNVNGLPIVNAGPDLLLCDQPIPEILTGFSPLPDMNSTGEWTGPGIIDPAGEFESPGEGIYTLYYTFTDIAGCVNLDSIEVEVVAPVIADAGVPQELCLNNGAYQLQGFNPNNNVTWSGTGITDPALGIFDPLVAGEGTFMLNLEFGSGTCFTEDSVEVTVLPLPVINTASDPVFCGNDAQSDLGAFDPVGGTWEGPGITDADNGIFDPSIGQGSYNAFYWYTDPNTGCADTSDVTVSVSPVPVADFTLNPEGCTNAPVDITNLSVGADAYEWTWGDGNDDFGFEPNFTYPGEGIFDVQLVAENAFGCRDSLTLTNEIIDPPVAELTLSPNEGCAPLEIQFGNNSVGQYLSYEWDLAVDTSIDEVPGNITYQQGDDVVEYDISLTATNYCGSDMVEDVVTVFPQPVAGFGTDYDEFCSPWSTEFNNTSVGNPDEYLWDFGDNTTSTLEEPIFHTYFTDSLPTDYTITLVTTNECGVDTFAYTITVLPNTVTAFFNTDNTEGCAPLVVEFTDFSEGGDVISYDFGDDNITNEPNPTHIYTEPGVYEIFQYVNNGCSFDTTTAMVEVFPSPVLDFETDVPNVCANQAVQFISLAEDVNNVEWDFGDGNISDITNPFHVYEDGGTYDVTMTATSMFNECEASIQMPFAVFVSPESEFTIAEQVGCSPFEVNFNNTTGGGEFYQWDFGDNETANGADVSHTFFNDTGDPVLYTVTLISENLQLCADTFQLDVIVSPTPVSDFTLSETESCYFPFTVQTTNNSTFADGFEWDFMPYGTSQISEPEITITQVGNWDVSLTSSNAYGCENTQTQTLTVHPLPTANYTVNPVSGCIPLSVNFTDASDGAVEYWWDFGDNTNSTQPNPLHFYNNPGVYDVSVIVTSAEGCSDTLAVDEQVEAFPLPIADFSFSPEETSIYAPEVDFLDQSIGATNWFWSFGDGYTATEANPTHTYGGPGVYLIELTVQNIHGCEARDIGQVTVDDQFNIYVPNAFTPDGDNINDVFHPQIVGEGLVDFYRLTIYDRWGIAVFETNDMDEVWIGDFRGNQSHYVQDDVYVWQIKYRLIGAEESQIITGHVTQVR